MAGRISFLLSIAILLITSSVVFADIIPNPIRVKGIIPSHPVKIQMVSERVVVKLSKDSSWVTCLFNMRNLGKAQDLEIGFPMMDFFLWENDYVNDRNKDKFAVQINGKSINKVDIFMPQALQKAGHQYSDKIREYEIKNLPWYLWKAHFDKNEKQVITVTYALPNSGDHQGQFFNYILSTGAGWYGNIEKAEVEVNLIDIPSDQLLTITPKNYELKGKRITWLFKDIKPTKNDDIFIKYERVKGDYEAQKRRNDSVIFFIDGVKMNFNKLNEIDPNNILSIYVNRGHPYEKSGAMMVVTKPGVVNDFLDKIRGIDQAVYQGIKSDLKSVKPDRMKIEVDNLTYSGSKVYWVMQRLDTIPILRINYNRSAKKLIVKTK